MNNSDAPVTSTAPSSKTAGDENFPVASLFLERAVRHEVMAFYHLARKADDIADAPDLCPLEKKKQLEAVKAQTDNPYLHDLIVAFLMDCEKDRYDSFAELVQYCRYSANPVGRFLLEVHGDLNAETTKASDALCTVLQILNHLQDCQKDFQQMDRIYLPRAFLADEYSYEILLNEKKTTAPLQAVFDRTHGLCETLILEAAPLSQMIRSRRLRLQARLTHHCARALLNKLQNADPLAKRVELTKKDKIILLMKGMVIR